MMHTVQIQAYLRFREQSERLVGFAVLVSYAVPELVNELSAPSPRPGAIRRSDFYHKSSVCDPPGLLRTASTYEQELASYVLLSTFSFFEAFVSGAIEELIAFHGGGATFQKRAAKRLHERLTIDHKPLQGTIAKLRTTEKGNAKFRYITASQALASKNFRFPGELLASYGIKSLIEDVAKLKAVHIPDLLQAAFGVPLTRAEVEQFHNIREDRNKVAHGDAGALDMRKVTAMGLFLRKLAVKTADHLSEHFFVIERFAP
jgi:hypothetical protein